MLKGQSIQLFVPYWTGQIISVSGCYHRENTLFRMSENSMKEWKGEADFTVAIGGEGKEGKGSCERNDFHGKR